MAEALRLGPLDRLVAAITLRPLIAGVTALVGALALLGVGVYVQMELQRELHDATAARLRATVEAKWTRFAVAPPGSDRLPLPQALTPQQATDLPRELSTDDVGIRLVGSAGGILGATRGFPAAAPVPNTEPILASDSHARSFEVGADGDSWLVYEVPLYRPDGLFGYLQAATSLRSTDTLVDGVRREIAIAGAVAMLAAVLVTLAIATVIARPLRRVAAAARAVTAGRLDARSGLPLGRNEAHVVAAAFDDMVGRLEAAFESQRRFLADASHELKTPLAAVGGMAELLREGADEGRPEQRRLAVTTIEREVDRMGRLVTDLLTLSRADQRAPLARERIDLCEVARDAVREARDLAPGPHLEVRADGAVTTAGDRETIRRAVRNLVDNAVRHTPGDGRVDVIARSEPHVAVLEIRDTGEGIAPEDVSHVFERFYRADPSRARTSGGSGLGLAIVRSVIEWHGGSVDLASELGRGTTVTIRLPSV